MGRDRGEHARSMPKRNYVYAPGKVVALVGVNDLVVVETEDALLITTRERSQDVGKVVAGAEGAGRSYDLESEVR